MITFLPLRSLKTGGVEVAREKWDEADPNRDPDESMEISTEVPDRFRNILPDWTRMPLPAGAPPAVLIPRVSPQAQVGA